MGQMPSTGVPTLDEIIGGVGYPDKSAILVTGPPGIGKEALGYWFTRSGLEKGDRCLYVTRLSMGEIQQDQRAFGLTAFEKSPVWLARSGGQDKLDINNLSNLSEKIRGFLIENSNHKIRIVMDILSSILMLNPLETAYRFVDQLIVEVKRHDAVLIATLEEGMHPIETQVAMEQLFDGFLEFSFRKVGFRIASLLRIGKMLGMAPRQEYYAFSASHSGMQLRRAEEGMDFATGTRSLEAKEGVVEPATSTPVFSGADTGIVFDYLVKSFVADYFSNRLAIEQSGWRTRVAIAEATGVTRWSFYGKEGRFGPILKELLSSGLVETRFFPGQRGRGGEAIKLRVTYEKELVKRIVDKATHS